MDQAYHISVLTREVVHAIDPKPGGCYLDVTLGGGGHTRALLEAEPECTVIALDWDTTALERTGAQLEADFPGRVTLLWGNFAVLYKLLKKANIDSVDGIVADFGTSHYQIKHRSGFSVYRDTPLDMRMSPGHQRTTAAQIVNYATAQELCHIFSQYGQERYAKTIADAIVRHRKDTLFEGTGQFAQFIEKIVGKGTRKIHPATRVFQALRIAVNDELENIKRFLMSAVAVLNPGGRIACITFHSLEDRLVKHFYRDQARSVPPQLTIITSQGIVPSDEEQEENRSSRSARLRVAEKR